MPEFFDPFAEASVGRHNLPHWQQGETWTFVTWRLADSLPLAKIKEWKRDKEAFFAANPEPWDEETHVAYRRRFTDEIEVWLDRGMGECFLKNPEIREVVASSLNHFDGDRYRLESYVIMPNHLHILFRILEPHKLPDIMRSLKTFSARLANQVLERDGSFWQRDYHDRLIRSPKHFHWAKRYIDNNPKNLPPGTFTLYLV